MYQRKLSQRYTLITQTSTQHVSIPFIFLCTSTTNCFTIKAYN